MISPFTQSCVVIASANAIFTFVLSLMAAPHLLLRDFKFLPCIDDRRFKAIELNDLCVAGSACEVGLCNSPERVTMYHGMHAVVLGGFRASHGKSAEVLTGDIMEYLPDSSLLMTVRSPLTSTTYQRSYFTQPGMDLPL